MSNTQAPTPAPQDISELVLGPSITVAMTLKMMELHQRVFEFALGRPALVPLSAEEQRELEAYKNLIPGALEAERERMRTKPDVLEMSPVHGFCL